MKLGEALFEGGWEGESRDDGRPVNVRYTKVKPSHLEHSAAETRAYIHRNSKHKLHHALVHPSKLRATQDWVEKGYDSKKHDVNHEKGHENEHGSHHPTGLRMKDGTVHLVDGHHRADEQVRKRPNKPMMVSYYDHDDKDYKETHRKYKY